MKKNYNVKNDRKCETTTIRGISLTGERFSVYTSRISCQVCVGDKVFSIPFLTSELGEVEMRYDDEPIEESVKLPLKTKEVEAQMNLECPECKQISEWKGYPSNPQLSGIQCLACGFIGEGFRFRRIKSI